MPLFPGLACDDMPSRFLRWIHILQKEVVSQYHSEVRRGISSSRGDETRVAVSQHDTVSKPESTKTNRLFASHRKAFFALLFDHLPRSSHLWYAFANLNSGRTYRNENGFFYHDGTATFGKPLRFSPGASRPTNVYGASPKVATIKSE